MWLSRDQIGENGGWNLYGMVGNNTINKRNLLGLKHQMSPGSCITVAEKVDFEIITRKVYAGIQKPKKREYIYGHLGLYELAGHPICKVENEQAQMNLLCPGSTAQKNARNQNKECLFTQNINMV
jgi:hypothetical protein